MFLFDVELFMKKKVEFVDDLLNNSTLLLSRF